MKPDKTATAAQGRPRLPVAEPAWHRRERRLRSRARLRLHHGEGSAADALRLHRHHGSQPPTGMPPSQPMHNVGGRWVLGSPEEAEASEWTQANDDGWTTKWYKQSRYGKGKGRSGAALAMGPPIATYADVASGAYRAASYDSSDSGSYDQHARPRGWRPKGKGKGKGRQAEGHTAVRNAKWTKCTECESYINVADLYAPYCGCGKLLLYTQCSQRLRQRHADKDLGPEAPARGWQAASHSPEIKALQKAIKDEEWWEVFEPQTEAEKKARDDRCAGLAALRRKLAEAKEALKRAADTPQTLADIIRVHRDMEEAAAKALGRAQEARAKCKEAEQQLAKLNDTALELYEVANKKLAEAREMEAVKLAKQEEAKKAAEDAQDAASQKKPAEEAPLCLTKCRQMLQKAGTPANGITDTYLETLIRHLHGMVKAEISGEVPGDSSASTEGPAKRYKEATVPEVARHQEAQRLAKLHTNAIGLQLAASGADGRLGRSRSPKHRTTGEHGTQLVDTGEIAEGTRADEEMPETGGK